MKEGCLSPTALSAFHGSSAVGGFYLVTVLLGLGINLLTKDELPALPLLSVGRVSHREDTSWGAALAPPPFLNVVTAGYLFSLCAVSVKVPCKMLECIT